LLDREVKPAGLQEAAIRTAGWPEGIYYCRLLAGAVAATQRLLVLR